MGTWGAGLYQNDIAQDLKPLIMQLLKLPISEGQIADLAVGEGCDDEDKIEATLILADQFEKKGVIHGATFERALHIISSGQDIARLRSLEMADAGLTKRQSVLEELAARLRAPRPARPRKTITKPKPLPVAAGDVLAYPVDTKSGPINPYYSPALLKKSGFAAVGWCVAHVVETGHEFGYLPWVAVLTSPQSFKHQPALGDVDPTQMSRRADYGTLSPIHYRKMGMVTLGKRDRPADLMAPISGAHTARSVALWDVSISNALMRNLWPAAR